MVPPKSNRKGAIACEMEKYGRRHRVENFFCWIKNFRRVATRHDRVELRGDDLRLRQQVRVGLLGLRGGKLLIGPTYRQATE